jgi:hypothetical protein
MQEGCHIMNLLKNLGIGVGLSKLNQLLEDLINIFELFKTLINQIHF